MTHDVCIEYAHTYLKELVRGVDIPDLTPVERAMDEFDDVTTVVIVDDTSNDPGIPRDDDFNRRRDEFTREYIAKLPIEPDHVHYESEFGHVVNWFMYKVPMVNRDELSTDMDLGAYYTNSGEGLFFYEGDGENTSRHRITDHRHDAKNTGYTCGAYDAAMTMAKLGEGPPVNDDLVAERALTFHNERYIDSPPYENSLNIQDALRTAGIVEFDDSQVRNVPLTDNEFVPIPGDD